MITSKINDTHEVSIPTVTVEEVSNQTLGMLEDSRSNCFKLIGDHGYRIQPVVYAHKFPENLDTSKLRPVLEGTMVLIKIRQVIEVESLKSFYETWSDEEKEEMITSIEDHGQKVPMIINQKFELVDGYRRKFCIEHLGLEDVWVIIKDVEASEEERIIHNKYRKKTKSDEVKEIKTVFNRIPKRQGKKTLGEKYNRHEVIARELGNRWKGDKTIKKVEDIINNDLENDTLLTGIVTQKWSIDKCHEYLEKWKDIDEENRYGFTERLVKGELGITEACKLIESRDSLNKYKDTFVIPNKSFSYNMNCLEIKNKTEFINKVDLIFTSVPYYSLRFYENGEGYDQAGHEETPEEYCDRMAKIFREVSVTMKDTGNVMINIGETYDNGVGLGIVDMLKDAIVRKTKLVYKDRIVWSKPNPKPQNEHVQRPINNLEYILWFVVDPKKAKYNLVTYTHPEKVKKMKITNGAKDVDENGTVWKKVKSISKPYQKIMSHIKAQDVLHMIECTTGKNNEVYKVYSEGGPAVMAELLPFIPIMMTTDENDIVYDPFAGTNVVGRSSILLNRVALSTELSRKYHTIGCGVIENAVKHFNSSDLELVNYHCLPEKGDSGLLLNAA
ncbi:DNA modification methylase [Belliella buryatensis]|uniref:DNA modification methylase n=1 Tax=Belliella buryatensis TaxID=1500549 RepID=A0A239GP79_9BACT|nr:DNA methyltransferase [Belliella buryatensis]SNS70675.1 DNA modification methylase [Belliella buryatensis]